MSSYRSKRRRIQNEVMQQLESINQQSNLRFNDCKSDASNIVNNLSNELDVGDGSNVTRHDTDCLLEYDASCVNTLESSYLAISNDTHDKRLPKQSLRDKLAEWSVQYNISHVSLSELLKILQDHVNEELPRCSKTLLKTPRISKVTEITGGKYFYFGITAQLLNLFVVQNYSHIRFPKYLDDSRQIVSLSLSTDGIPICKSTNLSMWPILMIADQFRNQGPMMVALFCGEAKPSSISEFLAPLISELKQLLRDGIKIKSIHYFVSISSIIADAPARSFVKCVKGHTAYHGCERCEDEGDYMFNRVVYSTNRCRDRTNESFRSKRDEDHHQSNQESPFLELEIDMVKDFVLDYMHLVCLGVMRKLLFLWLSGPLKTRLSGEKAKQISTLLEKLHGEIPIEFARKPRSLKHVNRFKATEYRQFLLYTGPSVLLGVLPKTLYNHFLDLHCAIKILLTDKASNTKYNEVSNYLFGRFVKNGSCYYGSEFVIYNIHNLLHLADDGLRFGNLDNFSAFPFENFMQQIKRYVRGQHMQLEQVVNRVIERDKCFKSYNQSTTDSQGRGIFIRKRKVVAPNFTIFKRDGNNCFIDKHSRVLLLDCILSSSSQLKCTLMIKCEAEFYPIPSTYVNVYKVKKTSKKIVVALDEIVDKCFLVKYTSEFYLCHKLNLTSN